MGQTSSTTAALPHVSLGHLPDGKWQFDATVTACFTDMLLRSIPQLDIMRKAVFALGCRFVHPGDHILDLGCSLGDALEPFICKYGTYCRYTGIEVSAPMRAQAQARFQDRYVSDAYGDAGKLTVAILDLDLRHTYPDVESQLTLAILTLMFIPVEYRSIVLRRIWQQTRPGGALLLVEKIVGGTADLAQLFIDEYHSFKQRSGYTREEIDRKALALEGVLVPLTAASNEAALAAAGFAQIECFWRWCNFAGWIAVKA